MGRKKGQQRQQKIINSADGTAEETKRTAKAHATDATFSQQKQWGFG